MLKPRSVSHIRIGMGTIHENDVHGLRICQPESLANSVRFWGKGLRELRFRASGFMGLET